ncbi:MAG: hypothetical protein R2844_12195 [Caldilineales bacterium]
MSEDVLAQVWRRGGAQVRVVPGKLVPDLLDAASAAGSPEEVVAAADPPMAAPAKAANPDGDQTPRSAWRPLPKRRCAHRFCALPALLMHVIMPPQNDAEPPAPPTAVQRIFP